MIIHNICNSNNTKSLLKLFPSIAKNILFCVLLGVKLFYSVLSEVQFNFYDKISVGIFLNYYKIKSRHQMYTCKNLVVLFSAARIFFINWMTLLCSFRCLNSYISCPPLQNQSVYSDN
jgi:hypothetical protein